MPIVFHDLNDRDLISLLGVLRHPRLFYYPITLSTGLASTWGNSPIATPCLVTALANAGEHKS
jgi:hypothetical protein